MTNLNELVPDIKISVNQIKGPYFTSRFGEDFNLLFTVPFAFLQASKKLLPLEFDLNRKQGFSIPLAQWLKEGSFRNYFYDVLLDSSCTFDREYVLTLLKGQDRGIQNSERLFGLLMFELWKKNYNIRGID